MPDGDVSCECGAVCCESTSIEQRQPILAFSAVVSSSEPKRIVSTNHPGRSVLTPIIHSTERGQLSLEAAPIDATVAYLFSDYHLKRKRAQVEAKMAKSLPVPLENKQELLVGSFMPKRSLAAIKHALSAADATLHRELDQAGAKLPRVTMVLMQDGTVVMRGNCGPDLLTEFGEALQKIGQAQSTSH